jgi:4'-phosphopantetheinyl transferase
LIVDAASFDAMRLLLDRRERERAARFHFDRDRRRFVVAHAALRKILASYCQIQPVEVEFAHGDHGKPKFTDNWSTISFNLSHSGDLALLVVARDVPVGIDVEHHRAGIEFECLSRAFFAPSEQAALMAVPPDRRLSAFYRCWTSKEAVLKALGVGLALPLDEFAVAAEPDAPARLLRLRGDPHPAAQWNLFGWPPEVGYSAAVAVRAPGQRRYLFGDFDHAVA